MATVYTVGHSTRSAQELMGLLAEHGVRTLVDVRRFPGSKRHPQFGREALETALRVAGIRYVHAPSLGGRRAVAADSSNDAWRNASFRGYADHMATAEFAAGLSAVEREAAAAATALMCAESVPWRCHRNLIADALVARGHEVVHVLSAGSTRVHALNAQARVLADGRLVYPGVERQGDLSL